MVTHCLQNKVFLKSLAGQTELLGITICLIYMEIINKKNLEIRMLCGLVDLQTMWDPTR